MKLIVDTNSSKLSGIGDFCNFHGPKHRRVPVYAFVRMFTDKQIDLEQDLFASFSDFVNTPEECDALF